MLGVPCFHEACKISNSNVESQSISRTIFWTEFALKRKTETAAPNLYTFVLFYHLQRKNNE
jgi:hypothetical protein